MIARPIHGTDEGLTFFFTNIKLQNKPFHHAKVENFPLSGHLVCDVDYRVRKQTAAYLAASCLIHLTPM